MSDYETIQSRRNVVVGVFVLIAICSLVWLVFKFGDLPIMVSKLRSFQIFAQFPSAPGVQRDTPVLFCGYKIGRVTDVMAPDIRADLETGKEYHQSLVVLSIENKYVSIPSNIDVKLMTRGLGSSFLEIIVNPDKALKPESEFLQDKMMFQGSAGMLGGFLPEETQRKLDRVVDGLDVFLRNANDILGDQQNKDNIKATLANLSEASAKATVTLNSLQKFLASGTGTSEELSKTAIELRLVLEKVNEGKGTAGRFVNDAGLYEGLLESTEQLQMVLEEAKAFFAEVNAKGSFPIKLK